jgi:predicted nuclease of predicted toxin-antitoxin system
VKFKIDENLPVEAAAPLRSAGFDALTVKDQRLGGENDRRIVDVCLHEQRALVTNDLDFSDIRSYPPRDFHGFVVLRLHRQDRTHVLDVLKRVLPILKEETLSNRLWIVEENRIRIRGADD